MWQMAWAKGRCASRDVKSAICCRKSIVATSGSGGAGMAFSKPDLQNACSLHGFTVLKI
jgi:hypothetical protein